MSFVRLAASAALAMSLACGAAQAVPVAYTFSGQGTGTIGHITPFTDENFSVVLHADTSAIVFDPVGDPGFYRLFNVGGNVTIGAQSFTLTPSLILVAGSSPNDTINFFNATVTLGLGFTSKPELDTYDLFSSFGPLSVPPTDADTFLTPTLGGGSFITTTDTIEFTGDTSLTFSAAVRGTDVAVPEPASFFLLGSGLLGLGGALRRKSRKARSA
jgi:hypothetical protein